MNFIDGEILHFDKPLNWTSFDLSNKVRWILCKHLNLKKIKVGHTGTLDPLATGLVTICTGKATKRIEELQSNEKEYVAELKLGATTPSFDLETEVDHFYPFQHITHELLEEKLEQFRGHIVQIPPVYSAVKIKGKRAYEYARKGENVQIKAKELIIKSIEILNFNLPQCSLKIVCSKGTYIRALARDIGTALDSGAYLSALRRTRMGNVLVDDAWDIQNFEARFNKLNSV